MKGLAAALLWVFALSCCIGQAAAADGRFIGDVTAKWLPNGRDMELTATFAYVDARGSQWSVPAGTTVDGASIPRALWGVVGPPFTGKYRKASVIHDYFCQTMSRPWQEVHRVFFEASLVEGNTAYNARLMYGAVYAWGPRWELKDGKPVRTRETIRTPSDQDLQELGDWIKGGDRSLNDIAVYVDSRFPRAKPLTERRVALVIGNSAYKYAGELPNPKNDATDIAASLRKLGFEIIDGFDLNKTAFERKVRDFAAALRGAELGLFFYAGHGLQVAGQNFLVPVDAQLSTADALDFEMIRLDVIHRVMERETSTNIIFLDACRNNPLARNLARAMGTRSAEIGRGLAAVESGIGTLISFSTQPGNVALDGTGRNSPFAGALVKHLARTRDDLSAILINVRNDVMKETQRKQVPWEHSALTGRVYFDPTAAIPAPAADEQTWSLIKDSKDPELLKRFVQQFPDSKWRAEAEQRASVLAATTSLQKSPSEQKKKEEVKPPTVGAAIPSDTFVQLLEGTSP